MVNIVYMHVQSHVHVHVHVLSCIMGISLFVCAQAFPQDLCSFHVNEVQYMYILQSTLI